MAWIKFEAARVKRLEKFYDFRREMGWSSVEALGFLGSFWGEAIEVCEGGDVTGWTPGYISELTGLAGSAAERSWAALAKHGWLDRRGERLLIHDWVDVAGSYLRKKYEGPVGSAPRARLLEIWALHGLVYGEKTAPDRKPTRNRPETDPEPTVDKRRLEKTPTNSGGAGKSPGTERHLDGFDAWFAVHPRKEARAAAEAVWATLAPDAALRARILEAATAQAATKRWHDHVERGELHLIPLPATWLTGRRWEDEVGPSARAAAKAAPRCARCSSAARAPGAVVCAACAWCYLCDEAGRPAARPPAALVLHPVTSMPICAACCVSLTAEGARA